MSTITDFHSHILPGMDDGSASEEMSIAMLQMAAEQGIGHVVATPHFYAYWESLKEFVRRREASEKRLREALANHTDLPKISIGTEVSFFSGISDADFLSELTIEGTRSILIEMPRPPWTDSQYRELANIQAKQGITPIIAHVDRYIHPFKTHQIPERLQTLPVLVQANAGFFLHKATAKMALRLLREDKIHLLGSDCHNVTSRAPNLGPALQRIETRLGRAALDRICAQVQQL